MAVSVFAIRISMGIALSMAAAAVVADDWVIAFPAPAADKAAVEKRYGATVFLDKDPASCSGCQASAKVVQDSTRKSFLRVETTVANYMSQHAGFSLPLDPIWSWNHDLRSAKAIRIRMRKISGQPIGAIGIEGPATPFSSLGAQPTNAARVGTVWAWDTLEFADFLGEDLSSSYSAPIQLPDSLGNLFSPNVTVDFDRIDTTYAINEAGRNDHPTVFESDSFNVLKHVRNLKFFSESTTRFGFDLDSIVFMGVKPQWGRIRGRTCSGEQILIDRFDANRTPGLANRLSGSWSVATDTSASLPSTSRGKSDTSPDAGAWGPGRGASMTARLARDSAWTNPDGGWARLSTTLAYGGGTINAQGIKAISFRIQAGQGANLGFDSTKVRGVTLRLHSPDVPDSVTYFVRIPYDSIRPAPGDSGRDICVELDELRQASWYTGKAGIEVIDPSRLSAISWTLALEDQGAVSATPSSISIREASLWKPASVGTRGRVAATRTLAVRGGHIAVQASSGLESFLEIRRLDGTLAARIRIAPAEGIVQVPVPRERGVFAAELRSTDGARHSISFAVP